MNVNDFPPCLTSLFGENLLESVKSINEISKFSVKMGPARKTVMGNSSSQFHPYARAESGVSPREEEEGVVSEAAGSTKEAPSSFSSLFFLFKVRGISLIFLECPVHDSIPRQYRFNRSDKEALQTEINLLVSQGIVVPTTRTEAKL